MFHPQNSHTKLNKWMHYSTLSITATSAASQLGTIYARVNPGQQGHLEVRCQQRHLHTYLSNNNLWRGRRVNRSDPEGCSLSWLKRREESQRGGFTADWEKQWGWWWCWGIKKILIMNPCIEVMNDCNEIRICLMAAKWRWVKSRVQGEGSRTSNSG